MADAEWRLEFKRFVQKYSKNSKIITKLENLIKQLSHSRLMDDL